MYVGCYDIIPLYVDKSFFNNMGGSLGVGGIYRVVKLIKAKNTTRDARNT